MTDGNTQSYAQYLDEREEWDALQEVTVELEQAEARIEELEAKLEIAVEMSDDQDPLKYLTLDTDELGIWLVDDRPEGPLQLGHISWKTITQGVQIALLDEEEN